MMVNKTMKSITKFLRFNDSKFEEDYNAYFQVDVKQKFQIFIYIECAYIIGYIIHDILDYFYSNNEALTQPFWLSIRLCCRLFVFFLFFILSILVIKNQLSSINKIDPIIVILSIIIIVLFDNPFIETPNNYSYLNKIGNQPFWDGYSIQFYNIFVSNLFNKWIYKLLYFGITATYSYITKKEIIEDEIEGSKILGFVIAYGIMVYYYEKARRYNYIQLRKLTEKDKMWKDIIDSLPEGISIVNKNLKPLYMNHKIKNYLNKLEANSNEIQHQQQKLKENQEEEEVQEPKKLFSIIEEQVDNNNNYKILSNFFNAIINLKLRNSLEDLKSRYKKSLSVYNEKLDKYRVSRSRKEIPDSVIYSKVNKYHPLIEGSTLNDLISFTNQNDDSQFIFSTDDFITFDSSFYESSLEIQAKYIKFDRELVLLMIFVDTTHRDLIAKLEQNDKYKNIVLSTVSHELRTPLNSAISMIKTILDNDDDTNNNIMISNIDKHELLNLSLRSLNMLANLINDILDYSQIQANKLNLVFQNIDLRQIIYDACVLFEIQCKKKGIQLKVDIAKEVPSFIRTDPNRLTQIILNLLSNAIKFTKKGYVKISVKWNNSQYGKAIIAVEDTGIGIKPEEQSKLFQEYGKIDLGENSKMNPTGCGLGLSISHKLAIKLGGDDDLSGIKVESEVDKGSIFSFSIENKQDNKGSMNSKSILNLNVHSDNCEIQGFNLGKSSFMSLNKKNEYISTGLMGLSQKNQKESVDNIKIHQGFNNQFEFDEGNRKDVLNSKSMKFLRLYDTISDDKTPPHTLNRSLGFNNSLAMNCCCDRSKISSNKPKLLIIDDDIVNLYSITLITKYLNYECNTANSAEEGLKLLQQDNLCTVHAPYDIIFMDFNMPDIDGLTASRTIKNMISNKELPLISIVGCTAFLNEEIKEKGIESGMDYIVEKPITKEKLLNIVKMFKEFV